MDPIEIKHFVEAALLAAGRPLGIDQLQKLFDERSHPEKSEIRQAITSLIDEYEGRGIEIAEVASGFRMQVRNEMVERLQKLWEERPPRYSRALFETLALIAYRQPMTRGEIEEIRGVSVSSNIVRTLLEREWIRVVGHRDVPGRPAMFGTTRQFLDYFGLKKLDDLPPLSDVQDFESLRIQLNLPAVDEDDAADDTSGESAEIARLQNHAVESRAQPEFAQEDSLEPFERGPADEDTGLEAATLAGDDSPAAEDSGSSALEDTRLDPIDATEWPDPNPVKLSGGDASAGDETDDAESGEATVSGR